MKRQISLLVSKLNEGDDGLVSGGFRSLKGGIGMGVVPAVNDTCTNSWICSGINVHGCSNTFDCADTTNQLGFCTNTQNCDS
jgi:hypothetical protein